MGVGGGQGATGRTPARAQYVKYQRNADPISFMVDSVAYKESISLSVDFSAETSRESEMIYTKC